MKKDKEYKISPIRAVSGGLVLAAAITLAVFLVCAGVMTAAGGMGAEKADMAVYITTLAAVFLGSIKAARMTGEKGLLCGVAVGVLYVLIMVLVGYIITPGYAAGVKTLISLAAAAAGGALGGVIGVNVK